jgi:ABC-type amino acid transport substrate-binding protein
MQATTVFREKIMQSWPNVLVLATIVAFAGCGRGQVAESSVTPGSVLRLVTTAEAAPYSYEDPETGELVGEEIEIARLAAQKLGCTLVTRKDTVFEKLLVDLLSGEADMAASAITITPAREEDFDFSIPYATEGGMFLYRAGEPMPTIILAEHMRIATVNLLTHDFYLSLHGIDPIRFKSYSSAVKALEEGTVDAVYYDSSAVRDSVRLSGGRLAASRMETREDFAIVIAKGRPDLKAALDEAIREIKEQRK